MKPYPLKFRPIPKERPWGGHKLRKVFKKKFSAVKKIGESWELADLTKDKSVITNGELAGKTIHWAIGKYSKEIMGDTGLVNGAFPLLIKLLDAQDILSVQVHPDPETCKRMRRRKPKPKPQPKPKTECWYIISSKPGAVIYKGLKKGVTKKKFTKAIEKGSVEDMLVKIPVKAGECHFLPAGTVHAIGPGLLIAEIQMPSDTTYRVYDWGRVDEAGKSRELHIKEALESIHFDSSGDNLSVTKTGRLVDCEYFKVYKGRHKKNCELPIMAGRMKTLIIISGSGTITEAGSKVKFKKGNTLLIPAIYEGVIRFADDTQYLTVTV
jgi:mannose-6-phosphate isomerase